MKSEVVFNIKEKVIRQNKNKKILFVSIIIIVMGIIILNTISFLVS
jgi:hypothetical protein